VGDLLKGLEKARTQYKEDEALFRENHPQDEAEALQQAEAVLEHLSSLGLELAHPVREEVKRDMFRQYYGDSGWRIYPAKATREQALLYWQVKEYWKREQLETGLRKQLEANLTSSSLVSSLRYLLASRLVHTQVQKTREMAKEFIEAVALVPKKTRKSVHLSTVDELDPGHLWRCYEQESKRMKATTLQWDESLEQAHTVGQLFLV
jgi:hypothetical protein